MVYEVGKSETVQGGYLQYLSTYYGGMSLYHVAIIGAGNLGSRHLQALALSKIPLSIEVMDSSEESLGIAKKRWGEMPTNPLVQSIVFFTSMSSLSSEFDVVIVATSSSPRRAIVEELLTTKKTKYLVLEKVLFQRIKDYDEVQALLEQHEVKAWVNCPRRTTKFYRNLADMMRQDSRIDMTVSGGDWGLGCNSIHMLDLYALISGQKRFEADIESLNRGWIDSKRKGYIEFTGTLRVKSEKGVLELRSDAARVRPAVTVIQTERLCCMVYEKEKTAQLLREKDNAWSWESIPVDMRNQSEVTQEIVQSLVENGNCFLTPYTESAALHNVLIKGFLEHINRFNEKQTEVCSIT